VAFPSHQMKWLYTDDSVHTIAVQCSQLLSTSAVEGRIFSDVVIYTEYSNMLQF